MYVYIYVRVSVPLVRHISETEHSFVPFVYRNAVMQHGRVTNLVSKFPPVVWRPSETCGDKGRLLVTLSSSPFHLKWLVLFYVMFIVIVLTSLNPNNTWLFISARISLISRIILFVCLIPPFPAFCMEIFQDFHWMPPQFTCIIHINSSRGRLVSQKCCRGFDLLIAMYTTYHPSQQCQLFPTCFVLHNSAMKSQVFLFKEIKILEKSWKFEM